MTSRVLVCLARSARNVESVEMDPMMGMISSEYKVPAASGRRVSP